MFVSLIFQFSAVDDEETIYIAMAANTLPPHVTLEYNPF